MQSANSHFLKFSPRVGYIYSICHSAIDDALHVLLYYTTMYVSCRNTSLCKFNNVAPVIEKIVLKSVEEIAAENAIICCKKYSTLALLDYAENFGILRHETNVQQ